MAKDPNQVNTAEIRSQIERTRAGLGHTIDAIQDRLSPRRVMHDAKETISDATLGRAKRFAHRMTEVVHSGNSSPNVAAVLDKAGRFLSMGYWDYFEATRFSSDPLSGCERRQAAEVRPPQR